MPHFTEEQINAIIAKILKLYLDLVNTENGNSTELATYMTETVRPMAVWLHQENLLLQQQPLESNHALSTVLQNGIENGAYIHTVSICVLENDTDKETAGIFQEPDFYERKPRLDIYQSFLVDNFADVTVLIEVYTTENN